ncbi:hypothetical protein H696_03573 [Fonticula alba]|uniref:Phospholipid-transporting ATPase n=1 Tax=Fonticula alba TaxID=691883 RepID=A0A058Z7M6_FONAL|nr:hypothetical protein H696_03573 [Fonticula alba]KCV70111.1 hypothetical protein H696_03573 [Fonticula alba]|eukprot:XP_009495717.1 hypothetical protein H696_03573 [Fonticula alba]
MASNDRAATAADPAVTDPPLVVSFNGTSQPSTKRRSPNYIRTTKYTLLTFLPINLFNQFRRFYNLYFLFSAILSVLPLGASPINPANMLTPLAIVLGVTAIKDAVEDYKRYRADQAANSIPVSVVRNGELQVIRSQYLAPGDVIRLVRDDPLPADVVLLACEGSPDGLAYISTADLDGETNLKRRTAPKAVHDIFTPESALAFSGSVVGKRNNPNLYQYQAVLEMDNPKLTSIPLGIDQLLLRGSTLRNTDAIYGVVTYVGSYTKLMLNLEDAKLKFSTLEHRLNMLVLGIFLLNFIVLGVSVILTAFFHIRTGQYSFYLDWEVSVWVVTGYHAMSFFILYTYLIPISLFVTMELARLTQAGFMFLDDRMRSVDGIRMRPTNSNLNEDLGRVTRVFSDKTGTLTQNIMRLRFWHVLGGRTHDEFPPTGKAAADPTAAAICGPGAFGRFLRGEYPSGLELPTPEEMARSHAFARALSVCHTVLPSIVEGSESIVYEGDSPDEAALMESLRENGIALQGRKSTSLAVSYFGQPVSWQILRVLEFNSTRKRMSVIVRDPMDQSLWLFTKGADNIIIERSTLMQDTTAREQLQRDVENFSRLGLRTLLVAQRPLSEEEFADFDARYHTAETSLDDRDERIMEVCETIEVDLDVLGATAVEDKLQEDVAETIAELLRAGVQVWMLTGDKLETAISIGQSTRLIDDTMHLLAISSEDADVVGTLLQTALKRVAHLEKQYRQRRRLRDRLLLRRRNAAEAVLESVSLSSSYALESLSNAMEEPLPIVDENAFCLVITGAALVHALAIYPDELYRLGQVCKSVICCRVTPLQKAQVVQLVRKRAGDVCLAIGDGANDVSMIQSADIGVGIIGLEGTQAVRASDYAFKEFRALKRLLLVHGRWSYMRMGHLIVYSFYKNMAMIGFQFWYGFMNGWSSQPVYQELIITFFNLILTSLPPFFLATFDRDLPATSLEAKPELFREVWKKDIFFNFKLIAGYGLSALLHSGIIAVCFYFFFYEDVVLGVSPVAHSSAVAGTNYGLSAGYWYSTVVASLVVVLLVLVRWGLTVNAHSWPMWMSFWLSIVLFFACSLIFQLIFPEFADAANAAFSTPTVWLMALVTVMASLLPDVIVATWCSLFRPTDAQLEKETIWAAGRHGSIGDRMGWTGDAWA